MQKAAFSDKHKAGFGANLTWLRKLFCLLLTALMLLQINQAAIAAQISSSSQTVNYSAYLCNQNIKAAPNDEAKTAINTLLAIAEPDQPAKDMPGTQHDHCTACLISLNLALPVTTLRLADRAYFSPPHHEIKTFSPYKPLATGPPLGCRAPPF